MSLSVPHFNSKGDVLVKGNVEVYDKEKEKEKETFPVTESLSVYLDAKYFDPEQHQRFYWNVRKDYWIQYFPDSLVKKSQVLENWEDKFKKERDNHTEAEWEREQSGDQFATGPPDEHYFNSVHYAYGDPQDSGGGRDLDEPSEKFINYGPLKIPIQINGKKNTKQSYYIELNHTKNRNFTCTREFSWEFIIWPDQIPLVHNIVTIATVKLVGQKGGINLAFKRENGTMPLIVFIENDSGWTPYPSSLNYGDLGVCNCWNHLILTYKDRSNKQELILYWNSRKILYLNDWTINSNIYKPNTYENEVNFNLGNQNGLKKFLGRYSKVKIYEKVLSLSEVRQNYVHYNKEYMFGGDLDTNSPLG